MIQLTDRPLTTPRKNGPNPDWIYPFRSPVEWFYRKDLIVLEYPKNLNKWERALNKVLKGPDTIRRPLDDIGTLLWELSDGEHSLLEIYLKEQETFKERVEPVDRVVGGLLEAMLKQGLLQLEFHPGGKGKDERKTGKRMVKRPVVK